MSEREVSLSQNPRVEFYLKLGVPQDDAKRVAESLGPNLDAQVRLKLDKISPQAGNIPLKKGK